VSWIHHLPSPETKAVLEPEHVVGHIKKYLAHHRKVKKNSLNILLHFSYLPPMQNHNHAYSLFGIHFEKTGYKHKWHKSYFTQQQRTNNNGPTFKCCILHKIMVRYIKHPQVVEFPNFSPSGMSVLFRTGKIKSGQSEKKTLTDGNPTCHPFIRPYLVRVTEKASLNARYK
jgi:hypothetical protein